MTQSGSILIATEVVADAELVRQILLDEFDNVVVSTCAAHAVRDLETHRPAVLVLAFDALAKSERYYLGLYRPVDPAGLGVHGFDVHQQRVVSGAAAPSTAAHRPAD